MLLYVWLQPAKRTWHLARTSFSDMGEVAQTLNLSRRGSSTKARWNRDPAFCMRPSRMVSARSWRWTLPYFSFLRIARAASVGPVACNVMASTRSGIPLRSSSSNCSLVRRSMATVTEEYGFFYRQRFLSGPGNCTCSLEYYWDISLYT